MNIKQFLITSGLALGLNAASVALAAEDAASRSEMPPGGQTATADTDADRAKSAPVDNPDQPIPPAGPPANPGS